MDVNCTECGDVRFGHGLDCNTRISNLRWYASNYLDDDRCGVVDDDDTIIVRLSEGKSREECERIATEHNEKRITESSPSAAPPVE